MRSEQIEDALEAFVRSKQKGADSGNYQRNARRVIEEWISWLSSQEDSVETFDQLQVTHMRQYARYLKERVDEGPSLARPRPPTGTTSRRSSVGVSTRNSSLKIQREHGAPKKNFRISARGAIASNSGTGMIEKPSSRISTSERTPLSTSGGWMRLRNSVIEHSPRCSPIRASAVERSFAIRTISAGVVSALGSLYIALFVFTLGRRATE